MSGYQPLLLEVQYNRKPRSGHRQNYKVRKKGSFIRMIRHESIGHRLTILNELINKPWPLVFGIGEHFFSRKQGFATTLCDLRKHTLFDIVKGRRESDLASYLNYLPGKERVQVVRMDLSTTYRGLIKKYFPNDII